MKSAAFCSSIPLGKTLSFQSSICPSCEPKQHQFYTTSSPLPNRTPIATAANDTIKKSEQGEELSKNVQEEVLRRRNMAIISHPDAGKSTLTEKLLLYGGAIQQAGSVRSRRAQRGVVSDSMAMEQERGISITSAVMTFDYNGKRINITDCPGHADFSEDTYRTLSAVDNAVMLIDGAKGLEPQTRKLFEICRLRMLPTFTFVNKMDRPALNPFEICDQIEAEFDLPCYPVVWPIGDGDNFRGVYERSTRLIHLFQRGARGKKADSRTISLDDEEQLIKEIGESLFEQLKEDVDILDSVGHEYDEEAILSGALTPLFFGSAMSNFGIELFLKQFLSIARCPPAKESSTGVIEADSEFFSGQVFKLQANMDARHRDRLAFVRVFSGTFERGMKVRNSRIPNRTIALTRPQSLFAADRTTIETAFAGDVIGLNNPGVFAIGDTIYETSSKNRITYPGIPSFSPELFAYIKNPNPSSYKNFRKGLNQLLEEGAVQLLRTRQDQGNEDPILAAVGELQFDVVQRRLKDEYNVDSKLERLPYSVARWVMGPGGAWNALDECGSLFGAFYAKDRWDRPVVLFKNQWALDRVRENHEDLEMKPWAFAPEEND